MPLVAKGDVNVHRILSEEKNAKGEPVYHIESVILTAGESIDEKTVPHYVLDDVKAGKVPLLELHTATEAKKITKQAEAAKAQAATEPAGVTQNDMGEGETEESD